MNEYIVKPKIIPSCEPNYDFQLLGFISEKNRYYDLNVIRVVVLILKYEI